MAAAKAKFGCRRKGAPTFLHDSRYVLTLSHTHKARIVVQTEWRKGLDAKNSGMKQVALGSEHTSHCWLKRAQPQTQRRMRNARRGALTHRAQRTLRMLGRAHSGPDPQKTGPLEAKGTHPEHPEKPGEK